MARRKTKKAKNKHKTANVVLVVMGIFILLFIVSMIAIYCIKGSTPDVLIQCVLGAGGLEALLLAGITVAKVIKGEKNETGEDGLDVI